MPESPVMTNWICVGVGGFLGAIARYGLGGLAHRCFPGTFPIGTWAVNVLGCFAIGAIMTLVQDRQVLSPEVRLFLGIGFLGSFTTFSTLGYETMELIRGGAIAMACWNMAANVVVGLAAVLLGRAGVRAFWP